ncbi:hypothetical protein G6F65_019022 [Rhizopus arrhizus]|nr:hypothetical protein G6F65_019022 [Rhizopus arrhizus]
MRSARSARRAATEPPANQQLQRQRDQQGNDEPHREIRAHAPHRVAAAQRDQRPDREAMRARPAGRVIGGEGDAGDATEHAERQVPAQLHAVVVRRQAQQRRQPAGDAADQRERQHAADQGDDGQEQGLEQAGHARIVRLREAPAVAGQQPALPVDRHGRRARGRGVRCNGGHAQAVRRRSRAPRGLRWCPRACARTRR